ncbi:MAG: hypothetical protein OXD50_00060 [Chloroflexi bacterium]|nr:hypothetical protein [Chloroflexota bacterium]
MVRLILSIALAATLLGSLDTRVHACECPEGNWSVSDDFTKSAQVFRGVVTRSEPASLTGGYEVDFDVLTVWKGALREEVTIWTRSEQCGFSFQEDLEYIVFVYDDNEFLSNYVSFCSRTTEIDSSTPYGFDGVQGYPPNSSEPKDRGSATNNELSEVDDNPTAPADPEITGSSAPTTWLILIVALSGAALIALLLWKLRPASD